MPDSKRSTLSAWFAIGMLLLSMLFTFIFIFVWMDAFYPKPSTVKDHMNTGLYVSVSCAALKLLLMGWLLRSGMNEPLSSKTRGILVILDVLLSGLMIASASMIYILDEKTFLHNFFLGLIVANSLISIASLYSLLTLTIGVDPTSAALMYHNPDEIQSLMEEDGIGKEGTLSIDTFLWTQPNRDRGWITYIVNDREVTDFNKKVVDTALNAGDKVRVLKTGIPSMYTPPEKDFDFVDPFDAKQGKHPQNTYALIETTDETKAKGFVNDRFLQSAIAIVSYEPVPLGVEV